MRSFSIILFFSIFSAGVYAQGNFPDTSAEGTLLASADKSGILMVQEANVMYPAILEGNEAQSLEYVEKFSTDRKDYLIRTYKTGKKWFPKAAAILKKYNIPEEFKILLALESGFNANAVSSAGAVGYWQIMDEVAKEYGMKIAARASLPSVKKSRHVKAKKPVLKNPAVAKLPDDRKNFLKSTHVAARYLKDRSRNLDGDWLLIAASYNCGVGNVWNALQKCGKSSPSFWDIKNYLPAETRAYVMNFIAMNVVFKNYEAFYSGRLYFRDIAYKVSDFGNPEAQPANSSFSE